MARSGFPAASRLPPGEKASDFTPQLNSVKRQTSPGLAVLDPPLRGVGAGAGELLEESVTRPSTTSLNSTTASPNPVAKTSRLITPPGVRRAAKRRDIASE